MAIVLSGSTGIDAGSLPVNNCGNTEVEGNLNLSGVGTRITGDFSNATASNRVAFQTSVTNGNTIVSARPNGNGTQGMFMCESSQDADNCQTMNIQATSTDTKVVSAIRGTAAYVPMSFLTGGSERMRIDTAGNVGIGTSSPVNSKFNKTFTTQITGSSSVAITAGDYSSGAGSTVTAVESFGNRYDSNCTFGGRFGASYRRSDGVAIPAGSTIGYYAFGGQWGTDVGYVPSKHLYTASICGVSEDAFTSSTAMATGISFRTGSTGESLGAVNTNYGTEKMRIDSSGNVLLTSATGGLGYGTGAGGTVTQLTSKSTTVTLNKPTGQIIMNNAALAAGSEVYFIVNNSLVTTTDAIYPTIPLNSPNTGSYTVRAVQGSSGFYLLIKNISGGSLSDAVIIDFKVIKGATA